MEYTIVPMDRSHVGQIAELERECFSAPWSEAMLTEALFDAQASFIVAESEDGGLLGYAGLHVVLDEGYIDNIAVDPNARRHRRGGRSGLVRLDIIHNGRFINIDRRGFKDVHPCSFLSGWQPPGWKMALGDVLV